MSNMVELVKQAAVQAVEAEKPVGLVFGTVVAESPLQIQLSQKLILPEANLLLSRNVTNYTVQMEVAHETGAAGGHGHSVTTSNSSGTAAAVGDHSHSYAGTKSYQVLNGLKAGERVLLARVQGGKKYIVLDRMEG